MTLSSCCLSTSCTSSCSAARITTSASVTLFSAAVSRAFRILLADLTISASIRIVCGWYDQLFSFLFQPLRLSSFYKFRICDWAHPTAVISNLSSLRSAVNLTSVLRWHCSGTGDSALSKRIRPGAIRWQAKAAAQVASLQVDSSAQVLQNRPPRLALSTPTSHTRHHSDRRTNPPGYCLLDWS